MEILAPDPARTVRQIVSAPCRRPTHARVGQFARVAGIGAGGVGLDPVFQSASRDHMPQDAFRGRRTADVAEADEQNLRFHAAKVRINRQRMRIGSDFRRADGPEAKAEAGNEPGTEAGCICVFVRLGPPKGARKAAESRNTPGPMPETAGRGSGTNRAADGSLRAEPRQHERHTLPVRKSAPPPVRSAARQRPHPLRPAGGFAGFPGAFRVAQHADFPSCNGSRSTASFRSFRAAGVFTYVRIGAV